jgi:hypothetical protein
MRTTRSGCCSTCADDRSSANNCSDGVVGPGEACDLGGLNSDATGSDCSRSCNST